VVPGGTRGSQHLSLRKYYIISITYNHLAKFGSVTMSEKVLVTGGAGFIGSHLVEYLLKRGDHVVVLDDFTTGRKDNLSGVIDHIDYIKGDIRDRKALDKCLDGVGTVYHMAAIVGVNLVNRLSDSETVNVDLNGTKTLLEGCKESGINNLFFASSSEVYGHYPQEKLPMSENDEFTPDTEYGKAKLSAEMLCKKFFEDYGIKTSSARYFNVYGPRQSLNGYAIPHMIHAAVRNEPLKIHGDGKQIRDFTYIDDTVDASVRICDGGYGGEVFNIGTGKSINMNDLANIIIRLCDSKSEKEYVQKRRPTDLQDKYSNPNKIKKEIGWEPKIGLEEGLTRTIEYFKAGL
jgi:UDP-glucose 4-epimerase